MDRHAGRRAELQRDLDRKGYRQEELRREQQRLEADRERIGRAAVRLQETAAANARELVEVAASLEQARTEAGSTEFDNTALQAEIEAARRVVDERQAALRTQEREAADARVELAALEEKARAAGANVRRLNEGAVSVERQVRAKRDQGVALGAEQDALANRRWKWRRRRVVSARGWRRCRRSRRPAAASAPHMPTNSKPPPLTCASCRTAATNCCSAPTAPRWSAPPPKRSAPTWSRSFTATTRWRRKNCRRSVFRCSGVQAFRGPEHRTNLNTWTPEHLNADPEEIGRLRRQVKALGAVNPEAIEEYERLSERYSFLTGQRDDLEKAQAQITEAIREIDATTRETFMRGLQGDRRRLR